MLPLLRLHAVESLSRVWAQRGLATAAATRPSSPAAPRAPLQLYSLDGRYAVALFNAAASVGTLSAVESDTAKITAALAADTRFRAVLESPAADRKVKAAVIDALVRSLKLQAPQTASLMALMLENRRLPLLETVCASFATLMRAHRREVLVNVTSHRPLDAAALKRVEDAIARNTTLARASGAALRVVNTVNPAILGGLIVEVGDLTVDLSASTKISQVTRALIE